MRVCFLLMPVFFARQIFGSFDKSLNHFSFSVLIPNGVAWKPLFFAEYHSLLTLE